MAFNFKKFKDDNVGTKANLEKLAGEIADMNYTDFTEGEDFKSLAKRYSTQGQKAMDDTVGKVAARTGGIASSYAAAAGGQAYNDYMGKLEDAARAMYDDQRQEKVDNLGISKTLYDQNYQEKMDDRAHRQQMREYYTGIDQWERSFDASNDQWNKSYDYTKETDAREDAREQILTIIRNAQFNENGDMSVDIPEELIKASGWDPLTINALKMEAMQNGSGGVVEPLDLTGEEVIEQLEGGNINPSMLASYRNTYGSSYSRIMIENGTYAAWSEDELETIARMFEAIGDTEGGDALYDAWYSYHGNEEEGVAPKLLKDRTFTVESDEDNGDFNYFGGINRNATVTDEANNRYELSDLIDKLVEDGSFKTRGEARRWIRENQDSWGVNG